MSDLEKKNKMQFSCLRDASCSRGWLRLVVQVFFGLLIVSSFILILFMAISSSTRPKPLSGCLVNDCRVICNKVPYYEEFESDIVDAAWQADASCRSIILTLKEPHFINNSLPPNWLSGSRTNVKELAIIGGNLQHISPHAFTSQFSSNIKTLILEKIRLTTWGPETFVGLSSLERLYIKDCALINITRNALHAVDDTLKFLGIKAGFQWNPVNITGSGNLARLKIVDFALNPFYNILDESSFANLRMCTTLFLNSCRITALGVGTFDNLQNIELLYLNDNFLVTIPDGIFDSIIPLSPRIAMHDNFWYCDCSNMALGKLFKKDLLMADPVCRYPDKFTGVSFSQLYDYCKNHSIHDVNSLPVPDTNRNTGCLSNNTYKDIDINFECHMINNVTRPFTIITADNSNECLINNKESDKILDFWMNILLTNYTTPQKNDWLNLKYSVRSNQRSLVELSSTISTPEQGLLWYRTSCPTEMYCVNAMPKRLRIFEVNMIIRYIFCPFDLKSGLVYDRKCILYSMEDIEYTNSYYIKYNSVFGYIFMSVMGLFCGAICIYILIHFKPHLLKGNKRILFVKHKEINALILPPDVPIRKPTISEYNFNDMNVNNIFLVSNPRVNNVLSTLERSMSFRSSNSNEASYISALQPTDEQLAQWRNKESGKKSQYDTLKSDIYKLSSIFDTDSLAYYSLNEIYETPLEVNKK